MNLNCVVVEDEPLASRLLVSYISKVDFLTVAGVYSNAVDCLQIFRTSAVDVLFLDIHLPQIKGLEFLQSLSYKPQVILTTAYHEYAIASYDLGVTDYLLKPIEFSRFLKAVNKLDKKGGIQHSRFSIPLTTSEFRFFKVQSKMVKVYYDQIVYVESQKEYVKIVLLDGTEIISKYSILQLAEELAPLSFLRVHRSFVISLKHLEEFSTTTVKVGDITIPIGRHYKVEVVQQMRSFFEIA